MGEDRNPGYYWVKCKGNWIVAYWLGSHTYFKLTNTEGEFKSSYFDEIYEARIPSPDDPRILEMMRRLKDVKDKSIK